MIGERRPKDAPIARRWTDRGAADEPDPRAARAAALLALLPQPEPLCAAALRRIEGRLLEAGRAPRRWQRWLAPVLAPVGVAAVLLLWLRAPVRPGPPDQVVAQRTVPPPEPAVPGAGALVARAGQTLRLEFSGGVVTLVGPGVARLAQTGPVLEEGRLEVRAGAAPVVVAVPDGRVRVAPAGAAAIEVHERRTVRVAAFVGQTTLERQSTMDLIVLNGGSSWSGAPSQPAGEVPASANGGRPVAHSRPSRSITAARSSGVVQATGAAEGERESDAAGDDGVVPAMAPAATEPDAPETSLAAESRLLGAALRALRQDRQPAQALAVLTTYRDRFPDGALRAEAGAAVVEALLGLGRRTEALGELERAPGPRRVDLVVLRGELRAEVGHHRGAVADFTAALGAGEGLQQELAERALYGRARGEARLNDPAGAREDLQRYLRRFPSGRFSDVARESLGK